MVGFIVYSFLMCRIFGMKESVYVFIDAQNLYLGVKSQGWGLDYLKFITFLKDQYHVEKIFLFIGYVKKYEGLYRELSRYGYTLVYRRVTMRSGEKKGMWTQS